MARSARLVTTALCAALVLAGCGTAQKTASPTASPTAEKLPAYAQALQTKLPEIMKANAIPGIVILVKSRDKGDWSATFGTGTIGQSLPPSMQDSFRVGSNTKTMTVTVILQLVQEGKLKLDDPISKFRPDVPNGDKITIAQLAEMRSGLFGYDFDLGFNATIDREPQKVWKPDELLAIAFAHPPNGPPGGTYNYSNTNLILLGIVVEQLTGMSASDAFKKRIFDPLGLRHIALPLPADSSIPSPHTQGYQFGTNVETVAGYAVPSAELTAAINGDLKPINYTEANPSWAWTAGGAISTVDDLAVYAKALVGGGLLDEKTQKLRMDSIRPTNPDNPAAAGYGLGIARFGPALAGHDGQLPGYSSFMGYDAESDITIIIGVNLSASPVNGENASVVLAKAVMAEVYGSTARRGADATPTASG